MNTKIENIDSLYLSHDYISSKESFSQTLNSCIDDFHQNLYENKSRELLFEKITEQHNNDFISGPLLDYMKNNSQKILHCFEKIIDYHDQPQKFEKSEITTRPYFKTIFNLYNKKYPEEDMSFA